MEVICKCGYQGDLMVQYETHTASRQLMEYFYNGYWQHKTWVKDAYRGSVTFNWACPSCGRVLVQQRGGLSYDRHEIKEMQRRLWKHNSAMRQWLKANRPEVKV